MESETTAAPIFLLGVPRSGTTLLRMMIDSHPDIMCGPEAPWITGRGEATPPNLWSLTRFLTEDEFGPVRGVQAVTEDDVYQLVAAMIDRIMSDAAARCGKRRWAEKTPENIVALPFLSRLFPNGRFVHIIRDGRDVALSTAECYWNEIHMVPGLADNTFENSLLRWVNWLTRLQETVTSLSLDVYSLRYEDLVASPEPEMRRLLEYCDVPWNDQVLQPYAQEHDNTPERRHPVVGEVSFYERASIDGQSLARWKRELGFFQRRKARAIGDAMLTRLGYEPTSSGH